MARPLVVALPAIRMEDIVKTPRIHLRTLMTASVHAGIWMWVSKAYEDVVLAYWPIVLGYAVVSVIVVAWLQEYVAADMQNMKSGRSEKRLDK
jgi:hypothetical protein